MSYTTLDNRILFSQLSDSALRMYMILKHLTESNSDYDITRAGMEYLWKETKGKTSQRTFVRAWKELQKSGLLYKYDIRHGGLEGFGCRWGLRKLKDTENSTKGTTKKAETSNSGSKKKKSVKESEKDPCSLFEEVERLFNSYAELKCKKAVKVKNPNLHTEKVLSYKEIASQFIKCKEKNIVREVIQKVVDKIEKYIDNIKYRASYITAALYNAVDEYYEGCETKEKGRKTGKQSPSCKTENIVNNAEHTTTPPTPPQPTSNATSRATAKQSSTITPQPTTATSTATNKPRTKFHNFEQRDTDYEQILRELRERHVEPYVEPLVDNNSETKESKNESSQSASSGKYINENGDTIIDGINIDEQVKQVCLSDTLIRRLKAKDHLSEMDYFMLGMARK